MKTEVVSNFFLGNAPAQHQNDYLKMWTDFLDDARGTLLSDRDDDLGDAVALLRRECSVVG